jgi:phospholipase C
VGCALAALTLGVAPASLSYAASGPATLDGAVKKTNTTPIRHVIIIMQENRSFDNYFGTYPGANGIPNGTCVPLNPKTPSAGCVVPFHDPHDVNAGGPHGAGNARADADDGLTTQKMDGFVYQQTAGLSGTCKGEVVFRAASNCGLFVPGTNRHDVMGYHTAAEIPNYWAYAQNFVLQDEMFEGVRGWSVAAHLDLTSEWSATCTTPGVLSTCQSNPVSVATSGTKVVYPWVNLFQLLDQNAVSWKYYLASGTEPDCEDDQMTCEPQVQTAGVVSFWNPAPGFAWVEQQGAAYLARHNPDADQFLLDVKNGTLPQVSWVVPSQTFSEHPVATITAGQEYVTSMINAVMQSPYWADTVIFVSWDDWGGFYDHVVPPIVDENKTANPVQGFGFRVPGLTISAYAKKGYIDHSVLSTDSYATFIEQLFLNGTHLDPTAMGQPDNRPDIRDALTQVTFPNGTTQPIGNLMNEFDFTQTPLPPLVLSTHIPVDINVGCASSDVNNPQTCTENSVTVKWKPVTGAEVPGPFTYQVLRDGVALPKCLVKTTPCVDRSVPSGTHYYSVESISANNVVSPASASAEADVP